MVSRWMLGEVMVLWVTRGEAKEGREGVGRERRGGGEGSGGSAGMGLAAANAVLDRSRRYGGTWASV